MTDDDLYERGAQTLLACWEQIAAGVPGASLRRMPGVAAAVFPHGPESAFYNNALLDRDLGAPACTEALDAMEAAYADAGIGRFAAWAHERDPALRASLEGRGYTLDETTRAMGMALAALGPAPPDVDLGPSDWDEYLRVIEVPDGVLAGVDRSAFSVRVARLDGENAAAGMAFDHDGDCGVFNVATLAHARRRSLGSGLTARLLHDARERGNTTATLQSTPIAEGVYTALGFRDLGRFLEFVPA